MTGQRTGGDVVAECLAASGVTHTFGVPGEQWLGILDAVGRRSDLTFISTRHEGGAANMAEACGKLTGRPAVVFGTGGVGAAHLAIGVHTARQDSTPLVVIVGQVSTRFREREAWQEIDVAGVFGGLAKHTVEIRDAERIPELLQRAIHVATSGRPGPVVVSIPEDLQSAPCEASPRPRAQPRSPGLSEAACRDVVDAVAAAERPVVVAGGGVRAAGARDELAAFADRTGLPVVQAWRRSDSFPQDHPRYLGQLGLGTLPAARESVLEADLLLVLGCRLAQVTTHQYSFPTPDQRVVHIDIAESTLVNQPLPAELALVADVRAALGDLNGTRGWELRPAAQRWVESCLDRHAAQLAADLEGRPAGAAKLARFAQALDRLLPEDAIVTCDAGDFSGPFAVHLRFRGERRFLGPTSGSMGYGLSAAIGAKAASPDRATVALCGDGGFLMAVQELETAVRYGLGVIALVCNNNLHGSIARHQRARYGGRLVGTPLGNPDFRALAESFGVKAYRPEEPGDYESVVREALGNDGPSLVEIPM